jgi:hypothetical protein
MKKGLFFFFSELYAQLVLDYEALLHHFVLDFVRTLRQGYQCNGTVNVDSMLPPQCVHDGGYLVI